jgi:hypothetical protein
MSVYKKINIAALALTVVVYFVVNTYWNTHCSIQDCDEILQNGWLRPLLKGSFWSAPIFGSLVLFPDDVWWAAPLSLKLVYDVSIHTGGIMSLSKADMAESLGQIFLIITAIFTAAHYFIARSKKRKNMPAVSK